MHLSPLPEDSMLHDACRVTIAIGAKRSKAID